MGCRTCGNKKTVKSTQSPPLNVQNGGMKPVKSLPVPKKIIRSFAVKQDIPAPIKAANGTVICPLCGATLSPVMHVKNHIQYVILTCTSHVCKYRRKQ